MDKTRTENRREMCKDCPLDPNSGKCGEHSLMKKILWTVLASGATMILLSWSTHNTVNKLTDSKGPIVQLQRDLDAVVFKSGANAELLREIRQDVKNHMDNK